MGPRAETLAATMHWIELFTLRRATEGLTDEEFTWCPGPGCWTLRVDADGVGHLDYDPDVAALPATSPRHPLTTIAWNLVHICDLPAGLARAPYLARGQQPLDAPPGGLPGTAAAACERLWAGWEQLGAALADADDTRLEQPWSWEFGETDGWRHIALMLNEVSHHAAQVCELRDLFRHLAP